MRRFNQPKFKYVYLEIDIAILTISFSAALYIVMPDFWSRSQENFYFCFSHLSLYAVFLAIFLFSFRYNNLYKRDIVTSRYRQLVLIAKSLVAGTAVGVLFMVFSNIDYFMTFGKDLVVNFLLFSLVLFLFFRALPSRSLFNFLVKKNIHHRKVLIIGGDAAGIYVAESLRKDQFADFEIVGFLDDYRPVGKHFYEHYRNLGKLEDIGRIVDDLEVDEILIAIDNAPYIRLIHIVEKSLQTGRSVRIYSDLLRVISKKMDVEHYSNIPIIELQQYALDRPAWKDKRTFDIILSSIALWLLSPLFLAIAIGIKLSSKGPVVFKQVRIGKNGKPFNFYKFRSMHLGTNDNQHKEYVQDFIKGNNNNQDKNIQVFKITDDPRIFRFGKFIRKISLDEFPQFFNVFKGDMTLVGPRPCLPYEWECYENWHKNRLNTLPGCTGLWQALGRSSVTFEEMVILDLYYISNMTLWLDFRIMVQTIPVIFFGKGGH
jgi:exopolysaccharide biosynthesis polyprenyl glycosylphosphotransferase